MTNPESGPSPRAEAESVQAKIELPRELMESCCAAAQEATMQGFDDSVLSHVFGDPKHRRLLETVYRMGFESGWRIREKHIAASVVAGAGLRADAALTMDQQYWLDRRADIIAALEAEGLQIWSDKDRVWLHRLRADAAGVSGWIAPVDMDGETVTPQRLVAWLDAKFSRHGEEEDKWAADFIRATLPPPPAVGETNQPKEN